MLYPVIVSASGNVYGSSMGCFSIFCVLPFLNTVCTSGDVVLSVFVLVECCLYLRWVIFVVNVLLLGFVVGGFWVDVLLLGFMVGDFCS